MSDQDHGEDGIVSKKYPFGGVRKKTLEIERGVHNYIPQKRRGEASGMTNSLILFFSMN